MKPFEFNTPTRILFGLGEASRLAEFGPPFGSVALLIHAGAPDSMAVEAVTSVLHRTHGKTVLIRQHGEPKIADVDKIVETGNREDCEFVIGLGGGSAIDMAKAVAGLLGNGGSALDYLE